MLLTKGNNMQINFFNYKIIKIWDKSKNLGLSIEEAASHIAFLFQIESLDIIEVVEKKAEDLIEDWFLLGDLLFRAENLENIFRKEKRSISYKVYKDFLMENWKERKEFAEIKYELTCLKNENYIEKFISDLEYYRTNPTDPFMENLNN